MNSFTNLSQFAQRLTIDQLTAELRRRSNDRERHQIGKRADVIRQKCRTLAGFIGQAWHVLEPDTPLIFGWHNHAVCEHLEAISKGQIQHFVSHLPPGSMKSLTLVFWNAWEWGPLERQHLRYMTGSYERELALRDNRRLRRLVESEWYQTLWPRELLKIGDQLVEIAGGGERRARAFVSMTGGRAHRVVIDDPHSTEGAESDAERGRTLRIFRESIQDRLTDQKRDSIIVLMQRLNIDDIGSIIERMKLQNYERLVIPMEFEPERKYVTSIGWSDPRRQDGELMCPERWPRKTIEQMKEAMTSFAWAAQYQQRPTPREGGMFKRHWFDGRLIGEAPPKTKWVRHWDLAATKKKTAARTAGVKMGVTPDGRYVIGHAITTQDEGHVVRKLIRATAEMDGDSVEISLPQDPGQAGKVQATDMVKMLAGFNVHAAPETGSKETRAEPFAAQCEAGNVDLIRGAWNEVYLDELCEFPGGQFKDQIDASSGAFARLASTSTYDATLSWVR